MRMTTLNTPVQSARLKYLSKLRNREHLEIPRPISCRIQTIRQCRLSLDHTLQIRHTDNNLICIIFIIKLTMNFNPINAKLAKMFGKRKKK